MMWIWLTAGMLAKTIHMSVLNFKKRDLWMIPLALGAGVLVTAEIAEDYKPGDSIEPLIGLPIGFAAVIAFAFKSRILPSVTEGTLFGYALVAGYLYVTSTFINGAGIGIFDFLLFLLLPMFVGLTFTLIITPARVEKVGQTVLMLLFICISIYIGYELARNTINLDGSAWELVIIGYSYLVLVANVAYILYFIPLRSKRQSMSERLANIRKHAGDLEKKYIAVDTTSRQIGLTVLVFLALLGLDHFTSMNDALLVSIVLSFMMVVHTPPEKSMFIPASEYKKW